MRRAVLILLAGLAWGQQDVVIRTTTRLVAVDVFAQDKNGQAVPDLHKEDFELLVNHKPQALDLFSALTDPPAEEPAALPRGTFTNTRTAAVARGRYTVFLLDWTNTRISSQAFARDQLRLMLPTLPPGTKVALYLINNGFQIVQEFTTDKELLEEKVDSLLGSTPASTGGDLAGRAEMRARKSVEAFRDVAAHLRGISGPKKLIWVTAGFPNKAPGNPLGDYIEDAIGTLAKAKVVVESIDACGLIPPGDIDPCEHHPDTMQEIADRTGGLLWENRADLDAAMREALDDRRGGYQISFYLPETQADVHSVEIRTHRPGVVLRYADIQAAAFSAKVPAEPSPEQLLTTAVDAAAVPLTVRVTKSIGNRPSLSVHLTIGSRTAMGKVFVMTRFASEEGEQLGESPWETLEANSALNWIVKIPPGADTMRILVRNEGSRDVGTVTVLLDDLPER